MGVAKNEGGIQMKYGFLGKEATEKKAIFWKNTQKNAHVAHKQTSH